MSKPGPISDERLLNLIKMDFDLFLLAQPVPVDLIQGIKEAENLSVLKAEISKFMKNTNNESQDLPQASIIAAKKLVNDSLKILEKHRYDVLFRSMDSALADDEFDISHELENKDELADPLAQLREAAKVRADMPSTAASDTAEQNPSASPDNPSEGVYDVLPSIDEPPPVQTMKVPFADESGIISAQRQAELIIQRFQQEIDAGKKVAITYSANSKQAKDIYKGYETGDFSIHGSNQAKVIKLVIEEIHKRGWEDKAHILPVATMSYDKKHNIQPVSQKSVKRDLGNIAQHVGAGWTVLGYQNQDSKPGELAVGGAISKEVWDNQKGLIREQKNKDYFDESMKKMLQGDYSGFEDKYNQGKERGAPQVDPSMAPVSKRTRAKTAVKGAVNKAFISIRERVERARDSGPAPTAAIVQVPTAATVQVPTAATVQVPTAATVQAPTAATVQTAPVVSSAPKVINDAPSPHVKLPTFPTRAPAPAAAQGAGLVKPQGPAPTPSQERLLQGEIKMKWTLQDGVYISPPMSNEELNKLVEKGLKNFDFERVGNTQTFKAKVSEGKVAELTQPTTASPEIPALVVLHRPAPLETMRKQHATTTESTAKQGGAPVQPAMDDPNKRKSRPPS